MQADGQVESDLPQARLLSASARALASVPPAVFGEAHGRPPDSICAARWVCTEAASEQQVFNNVCRFGDHAHLDDAQARVFFAVLKF